MLIEFGVTDQKENKIAILFPLVWATICWGNPVVGSACPSLSCENLVHRHHHYLFESGQVQRMNLVQENEFRRSRFDLAVYAFFFLS